MPLLDCTHNAVPATSNVCVHLLGSQRSSYIRFFTRNGKEFHLACKECSQISEPDEIPWRSVCADCFAALVSTNYWTGIVGKPETLIEPSNLTFTHRIIEAFGDTRSDAFHILHPIDSERQNIWLGLTTTGALLELNLDDRSCRHILEVLPTDLDMALPISLICSSNEQFICLVNTLATSGVVVERHSGKRILWLEREEDGNADVSPFPVAFLVHEGRTLLVHGTDWNRLDVSDPVTGELLTARSPTSYQKGEEKPPHDLDRFHGRLLLSPDQKWVADYGWAWHPVGVVRTWSLRHWIEKNPWESEDGSTLREFCDRAYFWSGPWCWVDNQTLAIWGYGQDSQWLIPAVVLFDVESGTERYWFAGPEVAPKEERKLDDALADFGGYLMFDRYLFAVSGKSGVSVWNIERGTRLHQDASFAPIGYHSATKEFLSLLPDGSFQLSRLVDTTC